ncbi:predicted protein [Naegleria gruberi]|uniref:Predicted protein n=1 Tax=Naegleria gruberi TaxID=5762 RepID=D2VPN3_NAEGR|nr:uncharacterized protein NAEGRDRAFT_70924 [Naegleria gruberi]EFC41154.1 predicted protein [Naegleria gruberi]|eukprot:XP_002673898.1 predicted protein [Naegleria gruberi strain NEG-M]
MPNLLTLSVKECIIKIKEEKDDSTRMLEMFKTPSLSVLTIEKMKLKNIPLVKCTLKTLKLDNNNITGDLTDFERLRVHNLELLSLSNNMIEKYQTYASLTKLSQQVIALGNVFDVISMDGEIKEFTGEEYHVERSKYFHRPINWVPTQNILRFIRSHTSQLVVSQKMHFKDLITIKQLSGEDPNLLFWNLLYSSPSVNKKNITIMSGFIQMGIKLNSQCSKQIGMNWIFIGLFLRSANSVRCTLLDSKGFEPSLNYIIENWSTISSQHEHINKLRK